MCRLPRNKTVLKERTHIGVGFFYVYFLFTFKYILGYFCRTKAKHSGGLLVDDLARGREASCNANQSNGRNQGDYVFLLSGKSVSI